MFSDEDNDGDYGDDKKYLQVAFKHYDAVGHYDK